MEAQQSSSQLKLEQLSSDVIQASKDLDTLDKKHKSFSALNMRFDSLQSENKNIEKELSLTKGRYEEIFVKYEKSQGENINLNEVINKLKKDKINAESIIKSQKLILARAKGFSEYLGDAFPNLFVIGSDGIAEGFSSKHLSMFKKAYEESINNKSVVLGEGIGLGLGSIVGNSKGVDLGAAVKNNSGFGLGLTVKNNSGVGLGYGFKSSSGVGIKSYEGKNKKKNG
ncbi:hypothetical protein [Pantoea sp. CCBC3-3-1]|uniref:hypothetical protein n=1 Tax=Pantoea sp. CCBC3-3-1 TaxID=2490851 RepID=UPI0011BF5205|nr:hypothetical protein [Pantoea sp. CCBC3-3-1]